MKEKLFITTKPGSGFTERLMSLGFVKEQSLKYDVFGGIKVDVFVDKENPDNKVYITDSFYGNKEFQKLSYDDCFGYVRSLADGFKEDSSDVVYCEVHGSDVEPRYEHFITTGILPQYSDGAVKMEVFHHDYTSQLFNLFHKGPNFKRMMGCLRDIHERYHEEKERYSYSIAGQAKGSERGFIPGSQNVKLKEGDIYDGSMILSLISEKTGVTVDDMRALVVPMYVLVRDQDNHNNDVFTCYYLDHKSGSLVHIPLDSMKDISDSPGFFFAFYNSNKNFYDPCLYYVKSFVQTLFTRNEENEAFSCFNDDFVEAPDFKGFLNLSPQLLNEGIVMASSKSMYASVESGSHSGTKGMIVTDGIDEVSTITHHHWLQWVDLPKSLKKINAEYGGFSGDMFRAVNISEGAEVIPDVYKDIDVPGVYKEKKHEFGETIGFAELDCLKNRLKTIDMVSRDKLIDVINNALKKTIDHHLYMPDECVKELNLGNFGKVFDSQRGDRISIDNISGNLEVWVDNRRYGNKHYPVYSDFPLVDVVVDALSNPNQETAEDFDLFYDLSGQALRELNDLSKEQCKYIDLSEEDIQTLESLGASELDMHYLSRNGNLHMTSFDYDLKTQDGKVYIDSGKAMLPLHETVEVFDMLEERQDAVRKQQGLSL